MTGFYSKAVEIPKRMREGFSRPAKCANFFNNMRFDSRKPILPALAALFIACFSLTVAAQSGNFESLYANFSIDLPKVTTVTRGFRDDGSKVKTAGMIYAWDTGRIVYTVRYSTVSGISRRTATGAERLAFEDKAVADTIGRYKGETVSKRALVIGGVEGTEIVAKIGAGKMTVRNFVIGGHAYSIQAIARNPGDEAEAVKRLDTFTVIDGRAILAKQADAAKPEPFAKTDSRTWPSDAKAENLRGPVRSVTESWEDLTGDAPQQGSILSSLDTYNRRGINTSQIGYERATGQPDSAVVFGFLKSGRAMRANDPKGRQSGEVTRLIRKRFDRKGRVVSETVDSEQGERLLSRWVRYVGNTSFSRSSGTLTVRTVTKWNRNGDPVASTFESPELKRKVRSRFEYLSYDRFGNWTRRTILQKSEDGKWEKRAAVRRKIEYYGKEQQVAGSR